MRSAGSSKSLHLSFSTPRQPYLKNTGMTTYFPPASVANFMSIAASSPMESESFASLPGPSVDFWLSNSLCNPSTSVDCGIKVLGEELCLARITFTVILGIATVVVDVSPVFGWGSFCTCNKEGQKSKRNLIGGTVPLVSIEHSNPKLLCPRLTSCHQLRICTC